MDHHALTLALRARLYLFYDFFYLLRHLHRPKLLLSALLLFLLYFFQTPFRILRKKRREPYGETPYAALEELATLAGCQEGEKVVDLGCGRGKVAFWFRLIREAHVLGLDNLPLFVERAQWVQNLLKISDLEFREAQILHEKFTEKALYYLYLITLTDQEINQLLKRFESLPGGSRFLTVSFALSEYDQEGSYKILKEKTVAFPWGEATVYLEEKN